jgi:hypothetical protein
MRDGERLSRRRLIASGAALAGAAAGLNALGAPRSAAAPVTGAPPGFPRDIAVSRQRFEKLGVGESPPAGAKASATLDSRRNLG